MYDIFNFSFDEYSNKITSNFSIGKYYMKKGIIFLTLMSMNIWGMKLFLILVSIFITFVALNITVALKNSNSLCKENISSILFLSREMSCLRNHHLVL